MRVAYTENAKQELDSFYNRQRELLEDVIRDRKYVFGDDVVEITASDIREASRYIQPINIPRSRSTFMRAVVLQIYLIMGILTVLLGVFYPDLRRMLSDNPAQAVLVGCGIALTFSSLVGQVYVRYRDERRKQYLDARMVKKRSVHELDDEWTD